MQIYHIARPHQTVFSLLLADDSLVSMLSLQYGRYFHPADRKTADFITITHTDQTYTLRYQEKIWHSPHPLEELSEILFYNTVYDDSVFALHGAAVEYHGKAIVFLGATTTGKTTLTAYLTQNGFGYLTDDCVLIDRSDLTVHPVTTPIHLREGGLRVLEKLGCAPEQTEYLEPAGGTVYLHPGKCSAKPDSAGVDLLYLPHGGE